MLKTKLIRKLKATLLKSMQYEYFVQKKKKSHYAAKDPVF